MTIEAVVSKPTFKELVIESVASKPKAFEPWVAKPLVIEPVVIEPAFVEPAVNAKPVVIEPVAVASAAVAPPAAKSAVIEPVFELALVEPEVIEAVKVAAAVVEAAKPVAAPSAGSRINDSATTRISDSAMTRVSDAATTRISDASTIIVPLALLDEVEVIETIDFAKLSATVDAIVENDQASALPPLELVVETPVVAPVQTKTVHAPAAKTEPVKQHNAKGEAPARRDAPRKLESPPARYEAKGKQESTGKHEVPRKAEAHSVPDTRKSEPQAQASVPKLQAKTPAPKQAPVEVMSDDAVSMDSTQTIRELTPLEINGTDASQHFAIQVSLTEKRWTLKPFRTSTSSRSTGCTTWPAWCRASSAMRCGSVSLPTRLRPRPSLATCGASSKRPK